MNVGNLDSKQNQRTQSMVSENKIKGKEKIKFVELGDRRKNKPIYVHVGGLNFSVKSQTL